MKNKDEEVKHDETNTSGLMPKLRFPEFLNHSPWEEKRLEEIFEFHTTANNSRADLSETGDTFYIHYGDIHTKFHTYIDFSKDVVPRITSGLYKNATFLKNGDLIVADASEDTVGIAKAVEVRGLGHGVKAIAGLHTILLRDYEKKYVNGFKGFLREIETVKKQIQRLAVGVKVYAVSKTVLKQVLLPLPSPPEQQKIADCLSSVDELIAAHAQKLDTVKAYKKGLMQQLFPAEGEPVPKLRFPDFRGAPEWEEKRLGKVAEIVTGNTPSTSNSDYYGGNRLFVSPADIADGRYITSTKTTITEAGFKETRPVKVNSILFVCIGSTIGKISQNRVECATNQQINSVIPFSGYSSDFMYSALECNARQIASTAGKHAVPIINKTDFSNTIISVPSFDEQQKVAECLTTLDELITSQSQKLDILKAHKKGLLQQLFPFADEVDG